MDELLKKLQKFIELKKAVEDLKKSNSFKAPKPAKIMSAGNPVSVGPKTTVSATSSTGMGRGMRGGGSNIRATTTWKGPSNLGKKQKVLIRPDVSSGAPALFDEKAIATKPQMVSGPAMMNVRKAGPVDGEQANPIDMGQEVNETGLRLAEDSGAQKYHIYDGKMRITSKPMTLGEINQRHGPTQKIESSGLRVIPHQPQPLAPQKLRRSSSEE